MNLQQLKADYLARHRMSLDDSAVAHVAGFVAFVEATEAPADCGPEDVGTSAMSSVVAVVTETVSYSDGTVATGLAPLPADSPIEPVDQPAQSLVPGQ